MIDQTQLTEALDAWRESHEMDHEEIEPLAQAARLLLDFPTDEQVEAHANILWDMEQSANPVRMPFADADREDRREVLGISRRMLVAVCDTMIGDG